MKNSTKNRFFLRKSYSEDLTSIAKVYPRTKEDIQKAELLQIASGINRLPFYKANNHLRVQEQYWACKLVRFKQKFNTPCSELLVSSLERLLTHDANRFCWDTQYLKNRLTIHHEVPHAHFDQYLEDFKKGLIQYKVRSIVELGFLSYKKRIEKNILGLKQAYSKIQETRLQEEAYKIADALSKSYQLGGFDFLYHYLFYQNRLIKLQELVRSEAKNDIYFCHSQLHWEVWPLSLS